eukprot:TRINITY_DN4505_c0_g1_i2.p1 TRINITY_DN4505_c0_g1~~TRINITY_DN4505_c0_g1_i2.p1  ORF type:complete len:481 (-),score=103.05 TRINITY_DN4505_c0_g1_i2:179-1621(-)
MPMAGVDVEDARSQAREPFNSDRFNHQHVQARPLPPVLKWIRVRAFKLFMCMVFGGTALYLLVEYYTCGVDTEKGWKDFIEKLKYASIPVVSVCFTWWHVWLGIQMCWYPIEFWGIPPVLGWQGIVPRRANIMAERSCDLMIGNLITIEEVINKIEPDDFFSKLGQPLGECCAAVLEKLAQARCPQVWQLMPQAAKEELHIKVMEETRSMFRPVVDDIKQNINRIFNIKEMAVEALCEDKPLLVAMFQEIGRKEFTFVLHVAAVMGFFLGIIQMLLFSYFHAPWSLPVSGLIIGYFTNWLAITLIFRPVMPHLLCGGYVNFQGVFLKRQQQVATELSTMICKHLIYARRMLETIMRNPDNLDKVLDIYQQHMDTAIEKSVGKAKYAVKLFAGKDALPEVKKQVLDITIEELPKHSKPIEDYMDRTFDLANIIGPRLAGLPPQEFEGMLRPVFQEDEWMVLLLGGVLGVMVGCVQAVVLGQ